jgi:hypothetical protein
MSGRITGALVVSDEPVWRTQTVRRREYNGYEDQLFHFGPE